MTVKIGDTFYIPMLITTTARHWLLASPSSSAKHLGLTFFHFYPDAVSKIRIQSGRSTLFVIDEITQANPGVVRTTAAHGLVTGDVVDIRGSNSNPSIDGNRTVTVVDATHFSVGVNVNVAPGTTGTMIANVEEVVGTMEPEGAADSKDAVRLGSGSALIALAPTAGRSLWLITTVATTVGGGCAVAVEVPAPARAYASSRFAS